MLKKPINKGFFKKGKNKKYLSKIDKKTLPFAESVFVKILFLSFVVSFHYFCGNSCVAKSTIMEEILHRYFSCKVREKGNTVICTFCSSRVS